MLTDQVGKKGFLNWTASNKNNYYYSYTILYEAQFSLIYQ